MPSGFSIKPVKAVEKEKNKALDNKLIQAQIWRRQAKN